MVAIAATYLHGKLLNEMGTTHRKIESFHVEKKMNLKKRFEIKYKMYVNKIEIDA